MPINKIVASKRGSSAIAAVLATATAVGGVWYAKAPDGKQYPAAVVLVADKLIEPWEALRTTAYLDRIAKPPVWTACIGETKGIRAGMKFTVQQCRDMLYRRLMADFFAPMAKCVKDLAKRPIGVQASMISGAYNFGVSRWCHSTAARFVVAGRYREACEAQTAFNKAGGKVIIGLVNRREMGDAQRIGEAEICISGIK
jgi:GH24 family phage-related lysozyme (muramidase)